MFYRPIACENDKGMVLELLMNGGRYGKKERQFSW
jgi:hypothetical protein